MHHLPLAFVGAPIVRLRNKGLTSHIGENLQGCGAGTRRRAFVIDRHDQRSNGLWMGFLVDANIANVLFRFSPCGNERYDVAAEAEVRRGWRI